MVIEFVDTVATKITMKCPLGSHNKASVTVLHPCEVAPTVSDYQVVASLLSAALNIGLASSS
jgi:hypothetical protein